VKKESRGTVITLSGNVLFASGKSMLLPGAQTSLNQVADALKDQNDAKILVEGHTDSKGSEASNMELSRARAEAVASYLASRGVPKEQITSQGYGPSRPVADNNTPEGRANNRRVEIVVQPQEQR
jgi:outer membrane protein OmpA-like peptidoglycan-associated protein